MLYTLPSTPLVSTEQQTETHTIASQVAALVERVSADGLRNN